MPNWMSLRAYSRHRGDALSAVQKAIASGRVSAEAVRRDEHGTLRAIDQERADLDWALNTDPNEALKNGKWPAGHLPESHTPAAGSQQRDPAGADQEAVAPADLLESTPADAADKQTPAAPDEDSSYLAARTREKEFQAKKAELDYLERVGELVSAAAVREAQFDIYRQHRDKLEQIPVNLAEKLAAETDPTRIEHVLRTEIRTTLNELSRAFAAAADAEGIAERTPVTA